MQFIKCYSQINKRLNKKQKIMKITENEKRIIEAVCRIYGVTKRSIRNESRQRQHVFARFTAWYIMKEVFSDHWLGLARCGQMFGNRDHTSVIHGLKEAEQLLIQDQEFLAKYETICQMLGKKNAIPLHKIEQENRELFEKNSFLQNSLDASKRDSRAWKDAWETLDRTNFELMQKIKELESIKKEVA